MSSPKASDTKGSVSRRRILLSAASLSVLAPFLAACGSSGFQPLYGATASGQQTADALKNVDISPIPGRVGQRVRNELIFSFNGGDRPSQLSSQYRLDIALREYVQSILVAKTGVADAQIYAIDATFKLVRLKDSKIVLQGNSYGRAPYDTNTLVDPQKNAPASDGRSIFGNVRAQLDAQNRAANTLASDIRTRIAAYLVSAS